MIRRAIQSLIVLLVRPYTSRELPGWGKVYAFFVGGFERNWLWKDGPVLSARNKVTGLLMELDLSKWSDRSTYFVGRWYSLDIQLAMADLIGTGDTVIDVGANRGNFSLYASRLVGPRGKVIAFEPNPICVDLLQREVQTNAIDNITVVHCGLSDSDAILTLTVPTINSGEGSFTDSAYRDNVKFQVPTCRGDDVLKGETPAVIKVDVEGFETNVIRGLSETIRQCSPVLITEVIGDHLERAGSSIAEFCSTMEGLGYKGFRLTLTGKRARDWGLSKFDPSRESFDAIWLTTQHEKWVTKKSAQHPL